MRILYTHVSISAHMGHDNQPHPADTDLLVMFLFFGTEEYKWLEWGMYQIAAVFTLAFVFGTEPQ